MATLVPGCQRRYRPAAAMKNSPLSDPMFLDSDEGVRSKFHVQACEQSFPRAHRSGNPTLSEVRVTYCVSVKSQVASVAPVEGTTSRRRPLKEIPCR